MSLYVLDTDIVSLFQRGHPTVGHHIDSHTRSEVVITVITVEEQLTGWYSQLRKTKRHDLLAAMKGSLPPFIFWESCPSCLSPNHPSCDTNI